MKNFSKISRFWEHSALISWLQSIKNRISVLTNITFFSRDKLKENQQNESQVNPLRICHVIILSSLIDEDHLSYIKKNQRRSHTDPIFGLSGGTWPILVLRECLDALGTRSFPWGAVTGLSLQTSPSMDNYAKSVDCDLKTGQLWTLTVLAICTRSMWTSNWAKNHCALSSRHIGLDV